MRVLEWVTNTEDVISRPSVLANDNAWILVKVWMGEFATGRPKATGEYSVEQLEEMGLIGLYRWVEEESK